MSGIYLKDQQRHSDEGRVSEKNYCSKNRSRAYVRAITENVNKLKKSTKVWNKSSLHFETCLQKLQQYKHKIKTISDYLVELTNDPNKLLNISDIYTQQDFWVIEISKSVTNYHASPLKCLRADDNFQGPVILQNQNQSMAMKNQISLVFPFLKCLQRLQRHYIFQLRNLEKLQNMQN